MRWFAATEAGLLSPTSENALVEGSIRAVTSDAEWVLRADGAILERARDYGVRARVERATCLLAMNGEELLVGTDEPALFLVSNGVDRLEAFDRAPTRERWGTPWGAPASVRSLATDGSRWFVNVHVGGVLRSDDHGASWEATIDPDVDVHQVVVEEGTVWLATGAAGLAVSEDGRTFQRHARGLHATYARAVALTSTHALLSVSAGPSGREAAIYRAPRDRPSELVRCTEGLPEAFPSNVDTGCLVARGDHVLAASADSVWRSDDEGLRWQRVIEGWPRVRGLAIPAP